MKFLFTNLFVLLFSASSFALGEYAQGEQLYIWATSGLNLRNSPDAGATKITKINFGEQVTVIDEEIKAHPFKYTMVRGENDAMVVNGHWVKIQFQEQVGYVFDGYLSKLPVMTNSPDHHPFLALELIREYGDKHFGGLLEERTETVVNFEEQRIDPDKGRSTEYKLSFKNGSYFMDSEESFSGSASLFIKDIELEEAYLIFNALTGFESKQKEQGNAMGNKTKLSSVTDKELRFVGEGMFTISISQTAEGVLLQFGSGC